MAKKPSSSFTTIVVVMSAIGLIAFAMTGSEPPAKPKTSVKKQVSPKAAKGQSWDERDLAAKFVPVNLPERNAFKPVVARRQGALSGDLLKDPGMLPPDFAGGEASWVFTGVAEVDGVKTALLENKSSGEGIFLAVGEVWRTVRVASISDDRMTLISLEGTTITLKVSDPAATTVEEPLEGEIAPVQPNGMSVVPEGRPAGGAPAPQAEVQSMGAIDD